MTDLRGAGFGLPALRLLDNLLYHLNHSCPPSNPTHSLVGGGGPVLPVVVPRGVLIKHLGAVRRPRHDVEPVAGLQRVPAPRPRLVLRLQEGGGRLDAEQRAGAHKYCGGRRR